MLVVADGLAARATARRRRCAEIADEPLIGFRACRSIEPFEAALRADGLEPNCAFRTNDNGTVQGLVAAGDRQSRSCRG